MLKSGGHTLSAAFGFSPISRLDLVVNIERDSAYNGDELQPGQRCASTTNRNFRGRQGRGVRTHLMSPTMAAAAAITGRLTDVREFMRRG